MYTWYCNFKQYWSTPSTKLLYFVLQYVYQYANPVDSQKSPQLYCYRPSIWKV